MGVKRSLRILMVAPTSFFGDTGCHVRILEEARALRAGGHEVAICTYRKGRDIDGFPIYRTLPLPWRQHYEVGSSRHKLAYDALLLPLVLQKALALRPDVIHAHLHEGALIGAIVGRLLRTPVVFDFQGSLTSEMIDHRFLNPNGPWYRPLLWLEHRIDRLPQAVITSTQNAANLLTGRFGLHPDRVTVVRDRVNTAVFRPDVLCPEERAALRAQLGIPPEALVVVYLGLLAEHQGTSILLRSGTAVVAEEPRAFFLVMGYPGVNEYRQYAHGLGLAGHVLFTGQMPYEQAARYLALGDVAVAPKISLTEGAGKILNYMAMGLPTVAFESAVNREYLGELGLYAPRADEASLAQTLLSALRRLPELGPLRQALRERACTLFGAERTAAELEAVYGRLLRSSLSRH